MTEPGSPGVNNDGGLQDLIKREASTSMSGGPVNEQEQFQVPLPTILFLNIRVRRDLFMCSTSPSPIG